MSDMRATERILEVIEEWITETLDEISDHGVDSLDQTKGVLADIRELRRRGDTLVRMDDLRQVLAPPWERDGLVIKMDADTEARYRNAVSRIEIALRGSSDGA